MNDVTKKPGDDKVETKTTDTAPENTTPQVDLANPAPGPVTDPDPESPAVKKGALILAGASGRDAKGRLVIVVQTRERSTDPVEVEVGEGDDKKTETVEYSHRDPSALPGFVGRKYPKGDIYFRMDPDIDFGHKEGEVVTLGVEVRQEAFKGFTRLPGHVNVGPAHPAFAAANYAYLLGAREIEVHGLDDEEKGKLAIWFGDGLPEDVVIDLT